MSLAPAHAKALILATGTWMQLQATAQELQAATLRDDEPEAVRLRERAHALLDSHLDQNVAAAQAARTAAGL